MHVDGASSWWVDGWGQLLQALVSGRQNDRSIAVWRLGRTGWMCFRRWAAWTIGRRCFRRWAAWTTAGGLWEIVEEEDEEFVHVDGDYELPEELVHVDGDCE
jgi:hypothetical protein